ncbi:MAG: FtsQ-type POTRA domain-containing protein [Acidobacteria bacterium]|jgi:cell division septal protein FtsQ|nr:MAG: FtsQ-type POTRA domain-containing protein [Acidobacteriota bacterium]GIU82927.1 MAG: hypothetical protein KatS3mg006_1991 [Pyrinomonadaceae bacterium]
MTVKQKKLAKRKTSNASLPKKRQGGFFFTSVLPFLLLCLILFCLGFVSFLLYQNLTESSFFRVKNIEIYGANRVAKDEIERIVRVETVGKSVWSADIDSIREKIEDISMIKQAVVSKILPSTIRVSVVERIPQLVAQIGSDYFWIDDEGQVLKKARQEEINWVLLGLEQNKSDKANKENRERVKMAITMRDEFKKMGIEDQIKAVNLSNLSEPQIFVEDSGEKVAIFPDKDSFGKSVLKALEVLKGRGKEIEAVVLQREDVIVRFRHL